MSFEIASSTTSVPLGQPFPGLRRLGSHTVDKATAQPSRLGRLAQFITQSARALGSYVVESVKVARMSRADRADYRAVRQAGGQLGELLGALSHTPDHPVDGVAADALVRALRKSAAPLALSGNSLEDLLKQRLPLHLKAMGTDELEALRGGLSLARKSQATFSPGSAALFAVIEHAVRDEQGLRVPQDLQAAQLRRDARDACVSAMRRACGALAQATPDHKAIVRSLDMVRQQADIAVKVHEDTAGQPMTGDEARALRRELMDLALGGLGEPALTGVFGACNSPETRALAARLDQHGRTLGADPHTAPLGLAARETGTILAELDQRSRAALQERHTGLKLPELPTADLNGADTSRADDIQEAVAHIFDPKWNKPYQKPHSLDHILSTPALLADFRVFAQSELNSENILFAEAATHFCRGARPGLTEADALIRDFVRAGADQEVNISYTQRQEVLDARDAMDSDDTAPSDRLIKAMNGALDEVGGLIMADPCMRFIQNGGNPRQS